MLTHIARTLQSSLFSHCEERLPKLRKGIWVTSSNLSPKRPHPFAYSRHKLGLLCKSLDNPSPCFLLSLFLLCFACFTPCQSMLCVLLFILLLILPFLLSWCCCFLLGKHKPLSDSCCRIIILLFVKLCASCCFHVSVVSQLLMCWQDDLLIVLLMMLVKSCYYWCCQLVVVVVVALDGLVNLLFLLCECILVVADDVVKVCSIVVSVVGLYCYDISWWWCLCLVAAVSFFWYSCSCSSWMRLWTSGPKQEQQNSPWNSSWPGLINRNKTAPTMEHSPRKSYLGLSYLGAVVFYFAGKAKGCFGGYLPVSGWRPEGMVAKYSLAHLSP